MTPVARFAWHKLCTQLAFLGYREAFESQRRASHISAKLFEFVALMGLAADSGIQGKAFASDGEGFAADLGTTSNTVRTGTWVSYQSSVKQWLA